MRRTSALQRNHYFIIGLVLGLFMSFYIPQDIWEMVQQDDCSQEAMVSGSGLAEDTLVKKFGQDFEPHLNLINKPLTAKKAVRYYIIIYQLLKLNSNSNLFQI